MGDIVEIGDFRVQRKNTKYTRGEGACKHIHVEMDDHGQIVECIDCGKQVTPWFALKMIVEYFERAQSDLNATRQRIEEEKMKNIHLLAARKVEKAWRGGMIPLCPHCSKPITPKDGLGDSLVSKSVINMRI